MDEVPASLQRFARRRSVAILATLSLCLLFACTPRDEVPAGAGAPGGCRGVDVSGAADLLTKVTNHSVGTVFCLSPGTYRLTAPLKLKRGQKLIGSGSRRTIITGAKQVTAIQDGAYWVIMGQATLGRSLLTDSTDQCRPIQGRDPQGMCVYQDQVFLADRSLWQVASIEELSPGEFYWDYAANRIYLADNPSGRRLEVSVTDAGISGDRDVVIRDLRVEKFATPVRTGAVSASRGWLISGVEVRLNHGAGIHMGPDTVVRRSFIHHNGQLGIHGGQAECAEARGLIVEDSEISYNNIAGYNWGWEGGATKWTYTDGLVARGNYVHDNYGMGLWTDAANIDVLFAGNIVKNNEGMGIVHELGYAAVIRDNVISGNGLEHPVRGDVWGAGILIDQSRDVEIYGNTLEGNASGITAVQEPAGDYCGFGTAEVVNLSVHDNTIEQSNGIAAGLRLQNESDQSFYSSGVNRWERNGYALGDPANGLHFYWVSGAIDADAWRSYGHD